MNVKKYASLSFVFILLSGASIIGFSAGELNTGPPPPSWLTIVMNNDVYLQNETLMITGNVGDLEPGQPVRIVIHYPNSKIYLSKEVSVFPNGTYAFEHKIEGKVVSGFYLVEAFYGNYNSHERFMVIAGPYDLTVQGKTYPIKYKLTTGLLSNITLAQEENSLLVHIVNSAGRGELTLELPRGIIDAKVGDTGQDSSFAVLIGSAPASLTNAEFTEILHENSSRTLLVSVPYDGVGNPYGEWYFKILGTSVVPEFAGVSALGLVAVSIGAISTVSLIGIRNGRAESK